MFLPCCVKPKIYCIFAPSCAILDTGVIAQQSYNDQQIVKYSTMSVVCLPRIVSLYPTHRTTDCFDDRLLF